MATLAQRLSELATTLGTDIKTLTLAIGNMGTLTTGNKTSLVAAINEVFALASAAGGSAVIDDGATVGDEVTWSVDKLISYTNALKQDLLGDTPAEAFNTLKEISDYILSDGSATSGMITAIGNRVRFDDVQLLTNPQKIQARANIGAYGIEETGNLETDLVTIYNTAKA